jgi:hypothetical protein
MRLVSIENHVGDFYLDKASLAVGSFELVGLSSGRIVMRTSLLIGTLFFISCSASAQMNWYVGGGVSGTTFESEGLQDASAGTGLLVSSEIDDTAFGGQLFVGLMFTQNFGVEVKYSNSGETDQIITFADRFNPTLSIPITVEASIDGFTLYGVGTIPFSKVVEGSVKLGYTLQDAKLSLSAFGASESVSSDDDGLAVAGLVRFRIGENWAITGELEYFGIDFEGGFKEPLRFSVNGEYHF